MQELEVQIAEANVEGEARIAHSSNVCALESGTWMEVHNKDSSDDETTCDLDDIYNQFADMYKSEEEEPPEPQEE